VVVQARLWVFAGEVTAAAGGMHDFLGAYDQLSFALQAGASAVRRSAYKGWFHIVDIETTQIIAGTREQAFGAPRLHLPKAQLYDG
jgi:hypothetical protein